MPRKSSPYAKVNINGHWVKKRSINTLLDRINALKDLKNEHYKTQWMPWFEKCPKDCISDKTFHGKPLAQFWGWEAYVDEKKGTTKRRIKFEISKDSYSTSGVSEYDRKEIILLADDNEMPILATDPDFKSDKDALDLIENRLKHTIKQLPHRQDLVDDYIKIQKRTERFWRTITLYENILLRMISDRYHKEIHNWPAQPKIVRLKNRGKIYLIEVSHQDLKFIDSYSILDITMEE